MLTPLSGFDSVVGPTLAAAQQARGQGISFWGLYLGGPGAYRAWTPPEVAVLRAAGFSPVAIWVPTYNLTEDPAAAADAAAAAAAALGIYQAVCLDTEEQMKADGSRLEAFVNAFCARAATHGYQCPVYAGGGYVPAGWPGFWPHWGSALNPAAGQMVQYGPATRFGMSVDVDLADPAFPLGSWVKPAPAPNPVPVIPSHQGVKPMFLANDGKAQYIVCETADGPAKHGLPGGAELALLIEVIPNQPQAMPVILGSLPTI